MAKIRYLSLLSLAFSCWFRSLGRPFQLPILIHPNLFFPWRLLLRGHLDVGSHFEDNKMYTYILTILILVFSPLHDLRTKTKISPSGSVKVVVRVRQGIYRCVYI